MNAPSPAIPRLEEAHASPTAGAAALLRLQAWLSPAFPVGGFSYSHGIEFAVEAGLVGNRAELVAWIATVLRHGSGLVDATLLAAAYRAFTDPMKMLEVARFAAAFTPTPELRRETLLQGAAFLTAVQAGWPEPRLAAFAAGLDADGTEPAYPVAVGAAAAAHGIGLDLVVPQHVAAFAAAQVAAAVKIVPLGQTDGIRAIAALEPVVEATAAAALQQKLDDIGSGTPMLDLVSMRHEQQYTRLFRS